MNIFCVDCGLFGLGIGNTPKAATAAEFAGQMERGGWSGSGMLESPAPWRNLQNLFVKSQNLPYEHGVAVTKKVVALIDGFLVGVQDVLAAGECAY